MNNVQVLKENEASSGIPMLAVALNGLNIPVVAPRTAVRHPVLIRFDKRQDRNSRDKIRGFTFVPALAGETGGHTTHRWTFVPPRITRKEFAGPDGTVYPVGGITHAPAIRITNRVISVCTNCRAEDREWHDIFRDKVLKGRNGIRADGLRYKCPHCFHDTMVATVGTTTLARRTEVGHDPLARNQAELDALKAPMDELAIRGDDGTRIELPRVWAVYDKGNCPDQLWTPQDELDEHVVKEAEAFKDPETGLSRPVELLPFRLAKAYHDPIRPVSDKLLTMWVDTRDVVGYVKKGHLMGSREQVHTIGWERELLPSAPRTPVPRRRSTLDDRLSQVG